jgi:hypothetical protein
MQNLITSSEVDGQDLLPYVEWSFQDINDAHEMTPPSPLSLVRMSMMKNRQGWQKGKGIVTSSMMKCHQGWKATHLNTSVKNIVINKIMEEWKGFWKKIPTILKGLGVWNYKIKIHVLDISALFDVHVIEYLDNSIFY